jgi:putative methionine-R-sulfoxide reductase with GAF domain
MDHYSILGPSPSPPVPETPPSTHGGNTPSPEITPEHLRFSGEDNGKSLTEMAQRDLNAALQLLAERAQYITGASGAAIALREHGEMVCRASAGSSAPELGAHLQVNSGLSGESVRKRQILRCDDTEIDARVNRESCRALGIASVMVMPLVREQEVNGVFELFSGKAYAFEERDVAALERMAEMIQTAVEHAEAAKRAQKEIAGKKDQGRPDEIQAEATVTDGVKAGLRPAGTGQSPVPTPPVPQQRPAAEETAPQVLLGTHGNVRKCVTCGFPVSEGRTLCLDCEAAQTNPDAAEGRANNGAPAFLAELAAAKANESWLRSHTYLIGALLVAAITVLALLWQR